MISFKNVQVKTTQGKTLLHGTSFELQAGAVVGIFGPNGSGKSTLLKTLAGQVIDREITGENLIDETDLFKNTLSAKQKAQKVLFLGSDFQTSFQISVHELLGMAKRVNPASTENVAEVAERFGIASLLSRSFDEMSDGEKQRVMLARGVIQAPKWLVLDETFSKIDLDHSLHLVNELKKLASQGRGIILVSHDMNLISEMVDELWLMKSGKIVVSGMIEEVLTSENLQRLYPKRLVHVVRSPDNAKKKVIY